MERLELDYIQLTKALNSLNDALALQGESLVISRKDLLLAAEDSTIKRFEYSYDSFWKYLKRYLSLVHKMQDVNSPKKVFLACVSLGICSLDEGSIFIDMADSRNETSHTYNIEASRLILSFIPRYHATMLAVVERIGQNRNP